MIIIGCCDDDSLIFDRMDKDLKEYFSNIEETYEFHSFLTAEELLDYCKDQSHHMDLLFMDIELPNTNGIELCRKVQEYLPCCQIAYNTNYSVYATEVYETEHCYYIMKDEFAQRLPYVIKKVKEKKAKEEKRIFVPIRAGIKSISLNQIAYIERTGRKSNIHLDDGCQIETSSKLDEILEQMNDSSFVKCHTSYVVALEKVGEYKRIGFTMNKGEYIPISRKYINTVKEQFGRWSGTLI